MATRTATHATLEQLTVRGLDAELERRLRALASERGISLNRAALELMRRGANLDEPAPGAEVVGSALDHLIGTWSEDEARELLGSIADLDRVDPDLWS